ncbi:MAG: hypothetical protein LC099_06450 [Anaerolineales bacterium]|nr:hypothetical protein [Anaerolineales bacterium]
MNWLVVFRWIHILSGVSWLGEVATINFVLVPAVLRMSKEQRPHFVHSVFPRIFHLASALSGTAIVSGAVVNYLMTGWKWENLMALLHTRWGISILIGGGLGFLLAMFHFFVESKLEPIAIDADAMTDEEMEKHLVVLKIIPRVGMGILLVIIVSMMIAARGF